MNNFYNSIDLFVLPSYYEALGCVYLESWATHTPFVGVEGQGISELIIDEDNLQKFRTSFRSIFPNHRKSQVYELFSSGGSPAGGSYSGTGVSGRNIRPSF